MSTREGTMDHPQNPVPDEFHSYDGRADPPHKKPNNQPGGQPGYRTSSPINRQSSNHPGRPIEDSPGFALARTLITAFGARTDIYRALQSCPFYGDPHIGLAVLEWVPGHDWARITPVDKNGNEGESYLPSVTVSKQPFSHVQRFTPEGTYGYTVIIPDETCLDDPGYVPNRRLLIDMNKIMAYDHTADFQETRRSAFTALLSAMTGSGEIHSFSTGKDDKPEP